MTVAVRGFSHFGDGTAGENRKGGLFTYGIPRYCVTAAVADESDDVVPTTGPESMVTEGLPAAAAATATIALLEKKMAVRILYVYL